MPAMRPKQVVGAVRGIPLLVARLVGHAPDGEVIIAGGAIRDSLRDVEPRDFDLFVKTKERALELMERVVAWGGGSFSPTSPHTLTGWIGDRAENQTIIQACHGWKWANPEALLDLFDFSVCQAGIWMNKGKWEGLVSDRFEMDLRNRRLALVHGIGSTTVERILRLYSKGFTPDAAESLSGGDNEGACYLHHRVETLTQALRAAEQEAARYKGRLDDEELFIRRVNAKVKDAHGDRPIF